MSGTLPIVLIVVVWLFVLAPIALRGRGPIRHTNEAFEETRVIHAGGEDIPTQRRRPRMSASDVHASRSHLDEDLEVVEPDDVLVESEDDREFSALGNRLGQAFGRFSRAKKDAQPLEVVDGAVVAELPQGTAHKVDKDDVEDELVQDSFADYDEGPDAYDYDDAYLSPADYLHDDADYELADDYDDAEFSAADESAEYDELSEEDLEFAARRRGRGGYDPEADAAATANRYHRRQRTLLILVAFLIGSLIAAGVAGGMVWIAPALIFALTVGYLAVLRQQVQQERALRARRIRHMRRARLGVRSAESQELGLPARLRRPGAVVLELDDDSADFAELPYTHATFASHADDHDHHGDHEPRRVS